MENRALLSLEELKKSEDWQNVKFTMGRYRDTWEFVHIFSGKTITLEDSHEDDDFSYTTASDLARDAGYY